MGEEIACESGTQETNLGSALWMCRGQAPRPSAWNLGGLAARPAFPPPGSSAWESRPFILSLLFRRPGLPRTAPSRHSRSRSRHNARWRPNAHPWPSGSAWHRGLLPPACQRARDHLHRSAFPWPEAPCWPEGWHKAPWDEGMWHPTPSRERAPAQAVAASGMQWWGKAGAKVSLYHGVAGPHPAGKGAGAGRPPVLHPMPAFPTFPHRLGSCYSLFLPFNWEGRPQLH